MRLNIKGFKCFEDDTFELNKVTLLTGTNGSGKSSIIQALLLIRQAVEANDKIASNIHRASLNDQYALNIGTTHEIKNWNVKECKISLDDAVFEMLIDDKKATDYIDIKLDALSKVPNPIKEKEFYYLNAERLGPRYISEFHYRVAS